MRNPRVYNINNVLEEKNMDIIAMARELGKAIQQDERYKRIDAAKKANDEDQALQDLIVKFNMKRSELTTETSCNP